MNLRVGILFMMGLLYFLPAQADARTVVEEASGSGNKVIGPFRVQNAWELHWDFKGPLLQIFVNQTDAPLPNLPVDDAKQDGPGQGYERQEKSGTFYLKVVAQGEWTITVVQLP
jgi:hypothetical protein